MNLIIPTGKRRLRKDKDTDSIRYDGDDNIRMVFSFG